MTIYLYPAPEVDAQKARREGDAWRSLGQKLFQYGIPLHDLPTAFLGADKRPKVGPFHIPLWDWDGIPAIGEAKDREPPDVAVSAMRIPPDALTCQNLADDDDERRRSVVLEFRVEVEKPGRVDDRGDGGIVGSMPGKFGGEP